MWAVLGFAGVSGAVARVLRGAVLASCLALWAPGCSGGAQQDAAQEPAQQGDQDRRAAAAARLEARQSAACQRVGEVLFACAVADAEATMSPEELAELDAESLKPAYMQEFLGKCRGSEMSPRQIGVYEECLADTRCEVFVSCLDRARPQDEDAAPARSP